MTLMDFMIQFLEVADGQPLNLPIDQTNMYFKLSKENFVQSENETNPSTGYNHNIHVGQFPTYFPDIILWAKQTCRKSGI